MLGLLLEDVADPQDHFGEQWKRCWACENKGCPLLPSQGM